MDGSEAYDMSCHFLCPKTPEEDEKLGDYLDDDCNSDDADPPKLELEDDVEDDFDYYSDTEAELTLIDGRCSILSRDKKVTWSNEPLERDVKTKLFSGTAGCSEEAKNCSDPVEAWSLFFTENLLQLIVDCTNEIINITRPNYAQEKYANPTNIAEIKAVIGLMYIIGALKAAHLNTSWLWATDGTGIEIFSCLMSQRRFVFLLRCLRFSNQFAPKDPLAEFRPIFSKFVSNCQRSFSINEKCCLDATLVPFRGDCPFLRYMPGETAKYGIKVYCLVDAESQFISNLSVCVEKQLRAENPSQVVKTMCIPIAGSGRIVAYSSRFGSVNLAESLLDSDVRSVCALKRTSSEIPSSIVAKTKTISRFFRRGVLVRSPDDNRILYSTLGGDELDKKNLEGDICRIYDDAMTGFQNSMKSCNGFSASRKSSRWPLAMFYFLLNVAGRNSQVVVETNSGRADPTMDFLKNLGRSLAQPHLQVRASTLTLPKLLLGKVRQFAGAPDAPPTRLDVSQEPPFKKLKRCEMCARSADRKTKEWCVRCRIAICREHGCRICVNCASNYL